MSKRIGILTYFQDENPGTFLQAYSVQESLQKRFPAYNVEIIDCKNRTNKFRFRKGHLNIASLIKDYNRYRVYQKCRDRYLNKSPTGIVTDDYESAIEFIEKQNYDLISIGSDTVLDLFQSYSLTDPGSMLLYWLSPRIKCKKIIFSASAGAVTYDRINDNLRNTLSELINDFDLIGVRDEMSFNLMKSLGLKDNSKLEIIPDPTFAFDIDHTLIEKVLKKRKIDLSKPTIGIGAMTWRLPICREIAQYYSRKGFQIVSTDYNKYADYCLRSLSPFEWAGIFKYFALTVTGSFHTTIFSIKNNTPAVAFDLTERRITADGLSKLYCLLKQYDLHNSNHIIVERIKDPRQVLAVTDSAMASYDTKNMQEKNVRLRERFIGFMDKIESLLY